MYDICGVGHITLDKVVTPESVKYMPGGTSYYFSNAVRNMPLRYLLVTSLGDSEMHTIAALRSQGISVNAYESHYSVYFENIYTDNPGQRTQRVLRKADPFTTAQVQDIRAQIFHLGPLLADDMSDAFMIALAQKGRISLDVQGLLRAVDQYNVAPADWPGKKKVLQCVDILKADDKELEVLTGCKDSRDGARLLAAWGVKEIVITFGNKGSFILINDIFYEVPAFVPLQVKDETGCGDTYMAGYLSQRILGAGPQAAGEFASAMAALKTETFGPFTGTAEDVFQFMARQPAAVMQK